MLLTVRETAERLRVSARTVEREIGRFWGHSGVSDRVKIALDTITASGYDYYIGTESIRQAGGG
jgi:hypothetical protein